MILSNETGRAMAVLRRLAFGVGVLCVSAQTSVGQPRVSIDDVGEVELPIAEVDETRAEIPPELERRGVIAIGQITLPGTLFQDVTTDPVVLRLDDNVVVKLVENDRRETGAMTIISGSDRLRDDSYFAFIRRNNKLIGGDIRYPGRAYSFRGSTPQNGNVRLRVLTIDPTLIKDERPPVSTPRRESSSGGGGRPDDVGLLTGGERDEDGNIVVDVMVAYTAKAAQAMLEEWATPTADEAVLIQTDYATFTVNLAFKNNNIPAEIRLATRFLTNYDESTGTFEDHVKRLWCACDGDLPASQHLNEVFAPWKNDNADIVSLWIEPGTDDTGIAEIMEEVSTDFAMRAVNVISWWAAGFPNYSFAHELGHNMSARHDRFHDNTDGKPFDHNHGFWNLDEAAVTVMGYKNTCALFGLVCDRQLKWSDPDLEPAGTWGLPLNDSWASHNRLTFEKTLGVVSQFDQHTEKLVGCCVRRGFTNLPGPCN